MSIINKSISGMFWSLLQSVGGRFISFGVMLLLARLLTPESFGLISLLTIFIQLSQALIVAGFNQALIQKKDTSDEDFSSVFWLNLLLSSLIYVILFLAAPLISEFYRQPLLTNLTRVLSLVFIINSFSYVQETRLVKNFLFKKIAIINIPSLIIGGTVSVLMALNDFGVWSIVAMQLVSRSVFVVQIWFISKWKPLIVFNINKIKGLLSFGSKLIISEIIHIIFENLYLIVIGKYFSLSSVGYYQNANNLVNTPSYTLSDAINKVFFSIFSSIQDDNEKIKKGFKNVMRLTLFLICPLFIFASVLAEPLFRYIFTEKWLPSVPYFQLLCIVGVFFPLNGFNLQILNIKGRSDLYLKLEIIKKIITAVGVIIAIPFGIKAIIIFQVINSIISYFINSYYTGVFIHYPLSHQILDILPIFLLTLFCATAIFFASHYLSPFNDLSQIFLGLFIGVSLYVALAKFLKLDAYTEASHLFRNHLLGYITKR
ncbi:lipopolysaccharide biosynthesis protein [Chryseobacterium sp. MDT2-18]|uniref:lipopolysaccharide biosynthesis protein n=1 Tax=Chryseobacterium sp. MDT2-18 TaxID=1259136 RepID=UPI00277DE4DE|nr:lipopolysaccharide biosynthesis protein [Chryseobacterium sp. MDT2-18]MDQ0476439.1 teichuronic acid exporter [Chryseobacterium sp. MDT2-18]